MYIITVLLFLLLPPLLYASDDLQARLAGCWYCKERKHGQIMSSVEQPHQPLDSSGVVVLPRLQLNWLRWLRWLRVNFEFITPLRSFGRGEATVTTLHSRTPGLNLQ